MSGKIYRYWLMVPSGLEEVALDELRERVPQIQGVNVEPGGRTGQIFFTFKRSPQQLAGLQAAMQLAGVVAQMHRVTVGQPGLDHLCDEEGSEQICQCVTFHQTIPFAYQSASIVLAD